MLPKVKRIYHDYTLWECYHAGMFTAAQASKIAEYKILYKQFFLSGESFKNGIDKVFEKWPVSCENFLTDQNINRLAWLGQASACISLGLPNCCKGGFWLLDKQSQNRANSLAFNRIRDWILEHKRNIEESRGLRQDMGTQMLLPWYS